MVLCHQQPGLYRHKKFPSSQKVMLDDTCSASYDYKVRCLYKKKILSLKQENNMQLLFLYISDASEKRLV